ncbi:MAG TPA: BTAD domain-containing putative transcriptional regulator [Acidimicrobiales bacterium]|nr:BTAD domain-containing putative transcriptional regulator [Acidimicrobiales bacterium]
MRFGILGPLEVTEGKATRRVGGPKTRTLLAALLVRANEVVPAHLLVSTLWPDAGQAEGANNLHTQLSRLRNALGGDAVERTESGYVVRCDEDELDALAFEQASGRARAALAEGRWSDAAGEAASALAWWRGDEALPEFADQPFAMPRASALGEERWAAVECGIDARLALGEHRALVGELGDLVEREPLREWLWGQLMRALYRCGRQAEALRAYERLRNILADQLGITPCAELVRLERAVLAQDPVLDWQAQAPGAAPTPVPTSTLATFLFTDVEHSTARWDRDPAAMGASLRAHDALVRAAIESHHGHVFGHPGDGFCAVFTAPAAAVAAALDAQLRLSEPGWSGDPLDVRMAVHTGEAEPREGNYFGATVNRVARLRDAAHGGQVLVSAATRELMVDAGPPDSELVDVGTWLFEGFARAERVYQLRHPGLVAGFPPLRSGRPHTGALPRPATSFVGRPEECEQVAGLLRRERLVTITGEGGLGKTRLALEVAHRAGLADYPDGVWFCDVSSVRDADGLAEHLATSMQVTLPAGGDARRALLATVPGSRLLLVVDNCETLRPAVARLVGDLLAAGPDVRIIATSRAALRVQGEQVLPLDPLRLPGQPGTDPGDGPAPAVQLLVDRARAAGARVSPDQPALTDIVFRLDGLPLAIELAAPRLATMSPDAVAARLDRRFDLLAPAPAGSPARHRTLWATVDWSFQLLGPDARTLFAALSVFRGGWTLDEAERIAPAAGLAEVDVATLMAELVDQSMVRIDLPSDGSARYDMLSAMAAYAADHLAETGAAGAVADRHASHFLRLAEEAVPHRRGPREAVWVAGLRAEWANLRTAYEWFVSSSHIGDALRLMTALVDELLMREQREIGRWAEQLLAHPGAQGEPLRAVALALAGLTAGVESRIEDARRLSTEALAVAAAPTDGPWWIAHNTLSFLAAGETDQAEWEGHLEAMEAHSRATGDPLAAALAQFDRTLLYDMAGVPERGQRAAEQLLDLAAERSNPSLRSMALLSHARVVAQADPAQAGAELHEALALASTASNAIVTQQARRAIEELHARSGGFAAALASLREVASRFADRGNVAEQTLTVISMLEPLVALGAYEVAATIGGAVSRTPWHSTARVLMIDATVADRLDRERYLTARRAGAAMTQADLVAYASAQVKQLAGDVEPA